MIAPCLCLLAALIAGQADEPPPAPATQPARRPPLRLVARRGWDCRLLIRPSDVDLIRLHCGTTAGTAAAIAPEELATHVGEFRRLKEYVDAHLAGPLDFGGLYPVAFMHVATGMPGVSDVYTACVERELKNRAEFVLEFDDVAAALDWCRDAIDPEVAAAAAERLLRDLQPLRPEDSPFEHVLLHPKLCSLAAAIALRDVFDRGSEQAARVDEVIAAGTAYFETNLLPTLKQLRGTAPCPSVRADFEADAVLAAELWQSIDATAWEKLRDAMTDALDVYFWSDTQWPGLAAGVMHDMGTSSPLEPGQALSPLAPGVAEILAHRTGSPVAAYYAAAFDRSRPATTLRDAQRLWLRILHGRAGLRVANREHAPLARRLGNGWVLMRGDWGPGATLLAFDAEQPFWLPRQHLDAGQFQIIRKGRLAIDSGDDVAFEATRMRGGEQHLGKQPGEFDTYAAATIAHNCLVAVDPREASIMVGRQWLFLGSQRRPAIQRGPAPADIMQTKRALGRLTTFDTNRFFSFASADLTNAYEPRGVKAAERAILLLHDGLVVVVDRVEIGAANIKTAWPLHLPRAPTVGGNPLNNELRRRAEGNAAGEWVYPADKHWLATDDGGGRLFVRSILPRQRRWRIIGGPGEVLSVPRGPAAGRPYLGSSERGFEYWLTPAFLKGGVNAWYRLGSPGALGNAFGSGAGWGRLEVESLEDDAGRTFVHVLAPCDQSQAEPPPLIVQNFRERLVLKTELRGRSFTIELRIGESPPGHVEVFDPLVKETTKLTLPTAVAPVALIPSKWSDTSSELRP
jgi:hypothetical protein